MGYIIACSSNNEHPMGTYVASCETDGKANYDRFIVIEVGEDSITSSTFTNFVDRDHIKHRSLSTEVFREPLTTNYKDVWFDITAATITDQQLIITSTGDFPGQLVATRLAGAANEKITIASNENFANKIFERWTDRSRWIFSEDHRLAVYDYKGKPLYDYEYEQFYSVDEFAGENYLVLHHRNENSYLIKEVTDSYVAVESIGCKPTPDTLRFLKDTIIPVVLPPAEVLAEAPQYNPITYSTYWFETQWNFTFMNNGIFKFIPNGHFDIGTLYLGEYTEEDGVIELNYLKSEFGNIRPLDPPRLFRLDEHHLRWPNGALLTREGIVAGDWEDLFAELNAVSDQLVNNYLPGGDEFDRPYIQARIISTQPQTVIEFKELPRRNMPDRPLYIDTLTLAEVRELYPYEDPFAD
ncbi:hypothetical protein [Lewinella sp. 4G2]|uniref:hypothetical protein n=1 Tax=Lewinella sp. 4G2 TaxID=1803372 RepID=UPI0012FCB517|nr:hypothetical protein [Lewinella sp. 4G2]